MRSQKLRRRPDTCHAFHPEVPRAAGRHGGRAHGWVAPRACLYPKCTDVSSCTLAWAVSGAHPAGWTQTRPVNPEGDPSRRTVTLVPPGKGLSWDITGSGASTHTHPALRGAQEASGFLAHGGLLWPTGIKPVPSFAPGDLSFRPQALLPLPKVTGGLGSRQADTLSPISQENAQDCGGTAGISVCPALLLLPLMLLLR